MIFHLRNVYLIRDTGRYAEYVSMSADITISRLVKDINFSNFYIVINETHQDVSIDDVIKSTYNACLEFVDKDYRGAKIVGDKQKSDKPKDKSVKTTKLVELLKSKFPGEPANDVNAKVGRITGSLKRSRDFKIEDLEKMLVDGKDDGIEFVNGKIQEAQDGMNFKPEIAIEVTAEDAASAYVLKKLENLKIENEGLKKITNDLKAMVFELEIRIVSLEK